MVSCAQSEELSPYAVGNGEPLKDLKKGRDVVKSAQRKQQMAPACCVNV